MPNNTHATHLPSSRRNLGIKTPTPNTQTWWQTYELDTNQTSQLTYRHTHLFMTYMYTRCQKTYTQELPTMFTTRTLQLSHLMFPSPYRQNTTCSRTRSYSPDDGHNDYHSNPTTPKFRHLCWNYQPCLPQGHYSFHILCFPLLTGRTPHAVGHRLILLMMGIMLPETCWNRSLIINIEFVACCWFSLFALLT